MSKLVIKTHNFELEKKGLKEFAQKKDDELQIDTVDIAGGFLGLGNHKVTGFELNNRLAVIQNHFIDLNATNNKIIKEFGQVYRALEALDKDYIQAILISIKATEQTSNGIEAAQHKITQIIDDQKKTLEVLKKFKNKLDSYNHLSDIDRIWNDCQAWHLESSALSVSVEAVTNLSNQNAKSIEALSDSQSSLENKIEQTCVSLNEQITHIETLILFMEKLDAITHIADIDEMWDKAEAHQRKITDLQNQDKAIKDIVNSNKNITDKSISELHNSDEKLAELINYNKEAADHSFTDLQNKDEKLAELINHNKEAADHSFADLQSKDEKLAELINHNKEAADHSFADLQSKDEKLAELINHNKEAADHSFADLQSKDETLIKLVQINKANIEQTNAKLEKENSAINELIQSNKAAVDDAISNLHEQNKVTVKSIEDNKLNTDKMLAEANERNALMIQKLNKKILFAYIASGVTFAIAIAELLWILFG